MLSKFFFLRSLNECALFRHHGTISNQRFIPRGDFYLKSFLAAPAAAAEGAAAAAAKAIKLRDSSNGQKRRKKNTFLETPGWNSPQVLRSLWQSGCLIVTEILCF